MPTSPRPIAVAPLFDAQRFPTWRYQRGGLVHDGALLHSGAWQKTLEHFGDTSPAIDVPSTGAAGIFDDAISE